MTHQKGHGKGLWIDGCLYQQRAVRQPDCWRINTSTLQESQPAPGPLNHGVARSNVIGVRNWDTRHSHARNRRCAPNAPEKDTTIESAKEEFRNAYHMEAHMNRSARTAECSYPPVMVRTLQVLQLNVRKQSMVQQSLINDSQLKDFRVLAIYELYARTIDGTVVTVPMGHSNWTKVMPTVQQGEGWAVRSMMWVKRDIELEQIQVQSADLTAVVLQLPDRSVLVVSVYIEHNAEALLDTASELHQLIQETRNRIGT